jgi:hypothetical protein
MKAFKGLFILLLKLLEKVVILVVLLSIKLEDDGLIAIALVCKKML